jgi:hypothetical protein
MLRDVILNELNLYKFSNEFENLVCLV